MMSLPRRPSQPKPGHRGLAEKLLEVQEDNGRRAGQERLPSGHEIEALAEGFLTVLFPEVGHAASTGDLTGALAGVLSALEAHLEEAVFAGIHRRCQAGGDACREHAQGITARLMEALPEIRRLLLLDVQAAIEAQVSRRKRSISLCPDRRAARARKRSSEGASSGETL